MSLDIVILSRLSTEDEGKDGLYKTVLISYQDMATGLVISDGVPFSVPVGEVDFVQSGNKLRIMPQKHPAKYPLLLAYKPSA